MAYASLARGRDRLRETHRREVGDCHDDEEKPEIGGRDFPCPADDVADAELAFGGRR